MLVSVKPAVVQRELTADLVLVLLLSEMSVESALKYIVARPDLTTLAHGADGRYCQRAIERGRRQPDQHYDTFCKRLDAA